MTDDFSAPEPTQPDRSATESEHRDGLALWRDRRSVPGAGLGESHRHERLWAPEALRTIEQL